MPTTMTSRQFNQFTSRAKKAAASGPVLITDRGRPAHVLMTYEEYERLLGQGRLVELLGAPMGVAEVDMDLPTSDDVARPATLD